MKGLKSYIILSQIFLFSLFNVVLANSNINKPLMVIRSSNFNLNTSDWHNATVISDDSTKWNTGNGFAPSIAIDNNGNIHVVWGDDTDGAWGNDREIMYVNYTTAGWSNVTIISDDYTGWNDGTSSNPQITIDDNNIIHVVWHDNTVGEWGTDYEIMYVKYNNSIWSNATVISDDYTLWNDGDSYNSHIAIDKTNNIHVVWQDKTVAEWGGGTGDADILYVNYTGAGWSNATVISDDYTGWNVAHSENPRIVVDNNSIIHVVWHDATNSIWGSDIEILYVNYTGSSWSNATAISDDYTGWNDGESRTPSIAVDSNDKIHVVWRDWTNSPSEWGTDREIMYTNYAGASWSNATVISDDYTGWNTGRSQEPGIAIDNNDIIHVVWSDEDTGDWGGDIEILYVSNTGSGWSNVSCISDVYGWNDGDSARPEIAIDISGTIHVVWEDTTIGEWGGGPSDREIMYTSSFIPTPSEPTDLGLLVFLLSLEADSLPLILSLLLAGTAVVVIIVIIYIKKMKK